MKHREFGTRTCEIASSRHPNLKELRVSKGGELPGPVTTPDTTPYCCSAGTSRGTGGSGTSGRFLQQTISRTSISRSCETKV
jgi:hypothetical protein